MPFHSFIQSQAVAWEPSEITALHSWYNPTTITGLSDGDLLMSWDSSHPNSNGFPSMTAALVDGEPKYRTNVQNGLPVVEFGTRQGNENSLYEKRELRFTSSLTSTYEFTHNSTGCTIAIVAKVNTSNEPSNPEWGGSYALIDNNLIGSRARGISLGFQSDGSTPARLRWLVSNGDRTFRSAKLTDNNVFPGNVFHVAMVLSDPAQTVLADRSHIRVDGSSAGGNDTGSPTAPIPTGPSSYPMTFGQGLGGRLPTQGMMGDVLFFQGVLSSLDVEKVEGYLAHKWGIASSLPSTHPYKNSAP